MIESDCARTHDRSPLAGSSSGYDVVVALTLHGTQLATGPWSTDASHFFEYINGGNSSWVAVPTGPDPTQLAGNGPTEQATVPDPHGTPPVASLIATPSVASHVPVMLTGRGARRITSESHGSAAMTPIGPGLDATIGASPGSFPDVPAL